MTLDEFAATLDHPDWQSLFRGLLTPLGTIGVQAAQQAAPSRTGTLRSSIHADVQADRIALRADAPWAAYVNDGTRPHTIYPRNATVLRFTLGGQVVFARVVQHPGTRPYAFMEAGRAAMDAALPALWRTTVKAWLGAWGAS